MRQRAQRPARRLRRTGATAGGVGARAPRRRAAAGFGAAQIQSGFVDFAPRRLPHRLRADGGAPRQARLDQPCDRAEPRRRAPPPAAARPTGGWKTSVGGHRARPRRLYHVRPLPADAGGARRSHHARLQPAAAPDFRARRRHQGIADAASRPALGQDQPVAGRIRFLGSAAEPALSFRQRIHEGAGGNPHLSVDPVRVTAWRERYTTAGRSGAPKIGLVFHANPASASSAERSIHSPTSPHS